MTRSLPPLAVILGLAGLLPFFGTGFAALVLTGTDAVRTLGALIAYGAVILAFLGGVHWGFALPTPDAAVPRRAQAARLGLGVVPSLVGWIAAILPLVAAPELGLAVLLAGFVGLTAVEATARQRGLLSSPYMWLRWGLSAGVVLCLAAVLAGRLAGIHLNNPLIF